MTAFTLPTGVMLLALCAPVAALADAAPRERPAQPQSAVQLEPIPADKDNDLKLYYADGKTLKGADAMARMQQDAELILWLAGNQFFAMDDVVKAFQKNHKGMDVGVITLPPGLILKAIKAGGWTYDGKAYAGRPDVYASVNLGHLQDLKRAGLMDRYAIYMHNELQIMVAEGNPKKIKGIDDLARPDVKTSMPNPLTEGIMKFYIKKVLQDHGIWDKISGGQECKSCQTTPNNWFTSVHHRETPERILDGRSDAGVVWKTEVIEAERQGLAIEGVKLPPKDNMSEEVAYAIGALTDSPHKEAASKYLAFLATPAAQNAYAHFGFVKATPEELRLKPIP